MSKSIKILNSSLILLTIKGVHRSLGFVSMLILARILTPEDFGIVAIATIVVFFCDVITESGSQQYIMQKKQVSVIDLNTSWTINIILKTIIFIFIFISSDIIASFFNNLLISGPLKLISLILPVGSIANPGLYLMKRELNYKPIMRLLVIEKILTVIFTITIVYFFRSYWGMIIGVFLAYSIRSVGSYIINDYRPYFCLANIKEQWYFSKWILLKGAVGYVKSEFDIFLISKIFTLDAVGGYNMMKNISSLPARELIKPMTEPLLPNFAESKNNTEKLSMKIIYSISILCIGTFPITVFLFHYSDLIVRVLFPADWAKYSYLLSILSLLIINFSIVSVFHEALLAIEKVKFLFYYDLVTFTVSAFILITFSFNNIIQFATARVTIAIFSLLFLIISIKSYMKINTTHLLLLLIPQAISSYLAVVAADLINISSVNNIYVEIGCTSVIFIIIYMFLYAAMLYSLSYFIIVNTFKEFCINILLAYLKTVRAR